MGFLLSSAWLSESLVTLNSYALESFVMTLPYASSGTTARLTSVSATIRPSLTAPLPSNRDFSADAFATVTLAS